MVEWAALRALHTLMPRRQHLGFTPVTCTFNAAAQRRGHQQLY